MIKSISSEEALKLVRAGRILILDVRTQMENSHARIKNSLLIPLQELQARAQEIPRDKPILVYCRSGQRSMMASQILESAGFSDILNLEKGIQDCPFECIEEGV